MARKSDRTRDVRLIFKPHTRMDPASGEPQQGYLCELCR